MEVLVGVVTEVFGAAEAAEIRVAEEDVVRHGRPASHLVGRGRKLLYPLPRGCFSCEDWRMSSQPRHVQVPFIFMTFVCAFCSILVLHIASLRNPALLD